MCHLMYGETMLLDERRQQILDRLAEHGQSVKDLSNGLGVSESTIRRDLTYLEQDGRLQRKYGGAMLTQGNRSEITDTGQPDKTEKSSDAEVDAKKRLAHAAADMVQDGSVVVLDIGPIAPLIARNLRGRQVTIITSNLAVMDQVRHDDAVDLVLVGGALRHHHDSLVGPLTQHMIDEITADIMFLCCTGVRGDAVVDNMAVEAPIRQGFIAASQQVVLLADDTKYPGTGSFKLCSLTDLDVLITTDQVPDSVVDLLNEDGKKVVQV